MKLLHGVKNCLFMSAVPSAKLGGFAWQEFETSLTAHAPSSDLNRNFVAGKFAEFFNVKRKLLGVESSGNLSELKPSRQ
jgi:hypothetical protein